MSFSPPQERSPDAWQIQIWNLPDDVLSRPQKLQFMLMLENCFNEFDPYRVVGDLLAHRGPWRGAIMDRAFPVSEDAQPARAHLHADLIKLRDIGDGHWNVDTLFLLTDAGHADELCRLAEDWSADEIYVIDEPQAGALLGRWSLGSDTRIVAVWWD
jgi:hypothetical protein